MKIQLKLISISVLLLAGTAMAEDVKVSMELLKTEGNTPIGTVSLQDSEFGLVLTPNLTSLTPGLHGFHIHQTGSCEPSTKDGKTVLGGAAEGHYDPDKTNQHGLPWTKNNHKGDLPVLYVDEHGMAKTPVLAPRLTVKEVQGKALMIHMGGDNHSDHPAALGGGGARMACGVIK